MSGSYKGQPTINPPNFADFKFMKNTLFILPFLLLVVGFLLSSGCYFDNVEELHPELLLNNNCDTTVTMSYQTNITPILSNSCGANNSCHSTQGAGGGVILQNYAGVKSAVTSGKLLSSILWDGNAQQMPKGSASQLNDCALAKIEKWIKAGALNN